MNQAIKNITLQGAVFSLALCSTTLALGAVNIELEVANGTLSVIKNNAQCAGEGIDCIEVKPGTQPHLFFTLKGGCSSGYRFSNFRILENDKQEPNFNNPLSLDISSDFCADPVTGNVNFTSCDNDLKDSKMKIKDHNRSVATVYYDVEVENCDDGGQVISLDPKIKNGGGN